MANKPDASRRKFMSAAGATTVAALSNTAAKAATAADEKPITIPAEFAAAANVPA
ncbi:MAG: hypothetical protein HOP19_10150, partial [Acidobacteria bacterium]|nr:hypothetical protein [Acidobacteriota bacterium]